MQDLDRMSGTELLDVLRESGTHKHEAEMVEARGDRHARGPRRGL